uniref:Protein kinase domain-containing protein n=1 Tax=Oryzias melastigma TaxID=30732 RepID=A0A3B3BZL6_ORYME
MFKVKISKRKTTLKINKTPAEGPVSLFPWASKMLGPPLVPASFPAEFLGCSALPPQKLHRTCAVNVHSICESIGELLGKGSYGRVFKCYKVGSEEIVAIKILENVKEGREEFKAMKLIKDLDPDQNNLMKFHECFSYNNATCLVYEILYVSLQIAFAQQMFQALSALKSIGVVHGDIKLDNILLVKSKSLRIKLIDFGFAKKANKLLKGTEIQITPFRAPEVILGLPLDESIDMWAVGSVLACLYNRDGPAPEFITRLLSSVDHLFPYRPGSSSTSTACFSTKRFTDFHAMSFRHTTVHSTHLQGLHSAAPGFNSRNHQDESWTNQHHSPTELHSKLFHRLSIILLGC